MSKLQKHGSIIKKKPYQLLLIIQEKTCYVCNLIPKNNTKTLLAVWRVDHRHITNQSGPYTEQSIVRHWPIDQIVTNMGMFVSLPFDRRKVLTNHPTMPSDVTNQTTQHCYHFNTVFSSFNFNPTATHIVIHMGIFLTS